MKIITVLILFLLLLPHNSKAQNDIIYSFDNAVTDSLKSGVDIFAKMFNKGSEKLNLFAVVARNNNEYEVYLQEFSHLPKCGFRTIIETSNRKLLVNKTKVPIIFATDILSNDINEDKIADIPLSGYYIKIITENYKQRVVNVAFLF